MITKEQAMGLRYRQIIYCSGVTNCAGLPTCWYVTGKIKTWKTRPKEFKLPLKHGLYDYGYLTETNAHLFFLSVSEAEENI